MSRTLENMTRGARKSHKIQLEGCKRNKLRGNCHNVVPFTRKNWWFDTGRGQLSKISIQGLLNIIFGIKTILHEIRLRKH